MEPFKAYMPKTLEDRAKADQVFAIVNSFMDSHKTREVNEYLSQMFASFVVTYAFIELPEGVREMPASIFTDLVRMINELAVCLPDAEGVEYIQLGRSQVVG